MHSLKIETVGPWSQATAGGVGVQQRRLILLREGKPIDSWRVALTPSEADLALLPPRIGPYATKGDEEYQLKENQK
jgi:hypothetical protein